jgi:hypothetical protein
MSGIIITPGYQQEEIHLEIQNAVITGTGAVALNLFQLNGAVRVIEQVAEIVEITTLANLTDMYADLWDGTVSIPLTKTTTANLSGLPVGTIFMKDRAAAEAFSILDASQCQISEVVTDRFMGRPFTIVQKTGDVDTFLRLRFDTTDAPVSFKINMHFIWQAVDGGSLTLL